jgi:glycosyltransferase involved in cell wall biosynthesis
MSWSKQGVSVIIPCFNRASTVEEAVRSVLNQSWPDLEAIVVDDGSEDDTFAVVSCIDDPRLRCFRNPKNGAPAARNHGFAQSKGTWIAFQDSDDIWLPNKLAHQMPRLLDSDFVAAYCGMLVKADAQPETAVHKRYPDPRISPLEGNILPSVIRDSYISTQMLVIRRDVFDTVGGFDESCEALQDWDLMLRIAQVGRVAFIDEDLVIQRMSDNSITRSTGRRLLAQERILAKYTPLIARFPGALAYHHHRLAGGYRRSGQYGKAAHHAQASLKASPFRIRYLFNFLILRLMAFTVSYKKIP